LSKHLELVEDPLGWILAQVTDGLMGVEEVVLTMTAAEILEPSLPYIKSQFAEANVAMPEMALLLDKIEVIMEAEKVLLSWNK